MRGVSIKGFACNGGKLINLIRRAGLNHTKDGSRLTNVYWAYIGNAFQQFKNQSENEDCRNAEKLEDFPRLGELRNDLGGQRSFRSESG